MKVNTVAGGKGADNIEAKGNVVVDSPASGTITGDSGIYKVATRFVTMTGHVVLKRGKDVMRGSQLTVNMVTGQAVLGAKAVAGAAGLPGGRVQGVFVPGGQ
jgi:lipopolysaccharide export system protein LptA